MENQTVQLVQISLSEFAKFIQDLIAVELQKVSSYLSPSPYQDENQLLTRKQAGKMLNVSDTTLFHWNNDGTLPARKIGRKVFYLKQQILDKLNEAA